MTKRIIIGNWKMNPRTEKEAEKLFGNVAKGLNNLKKTQVVICAPYIYLQKLKKLSKKISLGAQDAFFGDVGPFTGEISGEMLYNIGVKYIILGHSERRALGETDLLINKKIKGALAAGLTPILCVGEETRDERDPRHGYFNIVKRQVEECLEGVSKNSITKVIIAYEPVWAISSTPNRRDATAVDSKEMVIFIRKILSGITSPETAKSVRIIYGGSVNEKDAGEFLEFGGADGALPGRASLSADKFIKIVKTCEALKN